jgi:3-hydroxyisobutyrate dehydrogenase-like beta-hydroxyacid dehydrogenase
MSAEKKGAVGVIGLGIMGSAMAANLVKSGFEVVGTDIVAQNRDELTRAGGTAVADARAVGKRCRHIILALASEAALNAVCTELAGSCAKGTIVIETGTLPLAAKLRVRDQLAEKESCCWTAHSRALERRRRTAISRSTPAATPMRSGK